MRKQGQLKCERELQRTHAVCNLLLVVLDPQSSVFGCKLAHAPRDRVCPAPQARIKETLQVHTGSQSVI
jgi:hypothetical protein